jgi:oligosaccharide repeat unit polymerase
MLAVGTLYLVFMYTYETQISPFYEYYGMGWRDPSIGVIVLMLALNMSLGFLVSPIYRRPSQLFLLIQFLVVFLPSTVVCLNATRPRLPESETLGMVLLMYAGMLIQLALCDAWPPRAAQSGAHAFDTASVVRVLLVVAVLVLVATIAQLGSIFSLTDLQSMYEQREKLDEQSASAALRYGISWTVYALLPVLLIAATSLARWRRYALMGFCLLGYFVLFGITATKTTLFAPLIIFAIYGCLRRFRSSFVGIVAVGIAVLLLVPVVLSALGASDLVVKLYTSVVNFRIFSVPQLLYVQYQDFFSDHELTLGSHVTGISYLIAYPYDQPVYLVIGEYFYPGSNMTANSGMWAQDGIAAFGLIGIPIMSLLFALTLRLLDFAARGHDPVRLGGAMAMFPLFVSNVSFFTTLVSGGLGVVILVLMKTRPAGMPRNVRPVRPSSDAVGTGPTPASGTGAGGVMSTRAPAHSRRDRSGTETVVMPCAPPRRCCGRSPGCAAARLTPRCRLA